MTKQFKQLKVYGNAPQEEHFAPYVPQYQELGIEPQEYKVRGSNVGNKPSIAKPQPFPSDNPRAKRPMIPREQATVMPSSQKLSSNQNAMLNVGNNMEHAWSSSLDGEITDDLDQPIDPNTQMVDNNDYLSDEALGNSESGFIASSIQPNPYQGKVQVMQPKENAQPKANSNSDSNSEDLLSIVSELDEDSYLLIVSGVPVCSGPLVEIQEQASALAFGEHQLCEGEPTPLEDILVLKRVSLKMGLFLES